MCETLWEGTQTEGVYYQNLETEAQGHMVGSTNVNNTVARQRNKEPQSSLWKCMHRCSSTADITEWKAVLKAEPWCSLLPQLQTPLLCSALWCGNWDSHFFPQPAGSWTLPREGTGRAQKQELLPFRDLSSVWLGWIKTENNDNRNGGKTRSLYMRVSKMEPKNPKSRLPNIKYYKKTTGKRPTGS